MRFGEGGINLKKINGLITLLVAGIILNALLSSLIPLGVSAFVDMVKILAQVLILVDGLYILYRIHKRDEMVFENETIKMLLYYKENSRKFSDFPLFALIAVVFGALTLAMIIFQICTLIYFYFM